MDMVEETSVHNNVDAVEANLQMGTIATTVSAKYRSDPGIRSETRSIVEYGRNSHLSARWIVGFGSLLERRGPEFCGISDHTLGRHYRHYGDPIDVSAVRPENPQSDDFPRSTRRQVEKGETAPIFTGSQGRSVVLELPRALRFVQRLPGVGVECLRLGRPPHHSTTTLTQVGKASLPPTSLVPSPLGRCGSRSDADPHRGTHERARTTIASIEG